MLSLRFLALLLLASCASYDPQKTYKLTILHTNDHHGRFWQNQDGEWGLAARATLIRKLRAEAEERGAEVLVLDAGDVNTGVPQSDLLDAEPDFRGMREIGYDAMALGNHEFDNTTDVIQQQAHWAGFPFLSANVYGPDGRRAFHPAMVKNLDGLKVAVMGLTTMDTPLVSSQGKRSGLEFRDPVAEAGKLVPELRSKAHVVIALTHMGHYPDEKHFPNSPGDVTLARKVPGIDVVVGGHTQKPLFKPDIQNGTIIVQAHEWGKYVGRVDLEYQDGKLKLVDYRLIPVNHKGSDQRIPEDEKMLELLRPFKESGDKSLKIKVASSAVALEGERSDVRQKETNLTRLITTAYRKAVGADLAVVNGGSVRASIPAGDVTYEHLLTVLPFGNELMRVTLTGSELKNYLAQVFTLAIPSAGSYPHFSGLEAVYHRKSGRFSKLAVAGKPLDPARPYVLALTSFLAEGGDKYPDLRGKFPRPTGLMDVQVLKSHLVRNSPLAADDIEPASGVTIKD